MPNFDTTLDPSVTDEERELAGAAPFAAFALVDDQDRIADHDPETRGFVAPAPRTPDQATLHLKSCRENNVPIGGVGLCLFDERWNAWGVGALWPNANEAAEHGAPIHRFKTFAEVPRHMSVVYKNNHLGHISHGLGLGLTNTSDYHRPGFNGVATLANVADWCNATDWFGIETVNGIDVLPDPTKKPAQPKPWSLEDRLKVLKHNQHRAKDNDHPIRAQRYAQWVADLEKLIKSEASK